MCVLQEDEVSEELLTFHEVVNHMQEQEEEVIDDHRFLCEVSMIRVSQLVAIHVLYW